MEQILQERQIDWLLHFTQAENLPNIFKYGLLPKTELIERNIAVYTNDQYRYDECENAICMSIEFPNYKMFYSLRKENPDIDWAVLLINASVLLDFDCAFCTTNAGSAESYSIPIEKRKGILAFQNLFDEYPGKPTRKEMNIKNWHPTNPQAEVLVFEKVPITYIAKVFFQNNRTMDEYSSYIPDCTETISKPKAFGYRYDWMHWQR